ncbi:putative hydrolase of the HAD superfamily [Pelagirhabdus alkalitolerans]|uniref:Putative hydrolase of the HAD superfamily n=1 Tax=Pelagirhabdus alkalitolerans TaxID=1612202 RepID=A0A1G6GPZ0_9BACI|nr:HAD family hydrolase [Pelagirhabdus alkalitolerans]SDB84019.1 putative hydrolase of the HAD superfamily [Pelagirhabdus alkalitolerans]
MKTIIFDVDDTLYDQAQSFHDTFKALIDDTYSYDEIDRIYRTSREYSEDLFDQSEKGEISVLDWQTGRISKALFDYGIEIDDKKALAFHERYKEAQANITLFPEVKRLLEQLSQKPVRLAVLTNGEEKHQRMKITQLDLTRWIPNDHIFISGAYGVAKPHPDIFKHVEEAIDARSEACVYVGDSFEKDIIGAKQVGWQAVWMNHRKRQPDTESLYQADKEVKSAEGLADTLLTDYTI